jgi:hypothetical protein
MSGSYFCDGILQTDWTIGGQRIPADAARDLTTLSIMTPVHKHLP